MRFHLLNICLHRFDVDNIKKLLKSIFTLSVVFTIVLSFSLVLIVVYYNKMHIFINSSYDYEMLNFTEKDIQIIKNKPFVDSVFVTRIVSGEMEYNGEKKLVDLNLCDSFESSGMMYYGNIENVMKNSDNGIILDVITARKLKVGIHDMVRMNVGNEKGFIEFVVRKIIEGDGNVSAGMAIASYNDYFLDTCMPAFGGHVECSKLFVKVNDKVAAENYFYNEYISPRMGESSPEERKKSNFNSNIKRIWQIEDTEMALEYTPVVTIITSILGGFMCFFFIWRDSILKMTVMNRNYAIFRTLGMRSSFLILYFLIERCIIQVPAIFISCFLVKKIIYDLIIVDFYLPWNIVGIAGCLTVAVTVLMSLMISLLTLRRFKRSNLSMILAKE